jgi:hypothetical protein
MTRLDPAATLRVLGYLVNVVGTEMSLPSDLDARRAL